MPDALGWTEPEPGAAATTEPVGLTLNITAVAPAPTMDSNRDQDLRIRVPPSLFDDAAAVHDARERRRPTALPDQMELARAGVVKLVSGRPRSRDAARRRGGRDRGGDPTGG